MDDADTMTGWGGPDRREQSVMDLGVVATRMQVLHEDVADIKSVLKDLTQAITKLALIEERQAQASAAHERTCRIIEKLEARVSALELQAPNNARTNAWMERVAITAITVVAMMVAKHAGIM